MKFVYEYTDVNERQALINEHTDKYLIEERNITEGNFLVFSDEPILEKVIYTQVPQEEFENLMKEDQLLKAQNNALSERADFIEDVVAEMAIQVYQ